MRSEPVPSDCRARAGPGLKLIRALHNWSANLGFALLIAHMLKAPQAGVEMTKPPWPFWFFYPIESAVGMVGILLGSVVVSLGPIIIPTLGMTIGEVRKLYRVVNAVVVGGLIAWLALLVITYFSPETQHL